MIFPGTRLEAAASVDGTVCGAGTFSRKGNIYASLTGQVQSTTNKEAEKAVSVSTGKVINPIPAVNSVVICRVLKISSTMAHAEILVVDDIPTKQNFKAIIRKQDVRAVDKDRVQIHECFLPGDIIRAEVISLGDSQSYHLATSKNELGVIFARSIVGKMMFPVSWKEMRCPVTSRTELRKCAKFSGL